MMSVPTSGAPLTPNQRKLLSVVYRDFASTGLWPRFGEIDRHLARDSLDALEIIKSLPSGFLHVGTPDQFAPSEDSKLPLSIRALHLLGHETDVERAVEVIRWAAGRWPYVDPASNPDDSRVAHEDAARLLRLSPDSNDVARVGALLRHENWGWISASGEKDWSFTVGREVHRFAKVATVADYLALQAGPSRDVAAPRPALLRRLVNRQSSWSRSEKGTVMSVLVALLVGVATVFATLMPAEIRCALGVGLCGEGSSDQESSPSLTSSPVPDPTETRPVVVLVPPGEDHVLDVFAGRASFTAGNRWRLVLAAPDGGQCSADIHAADLAPRHVAGAEIIVHGRRPGTFSLADISGCTIASVEGRDDASGVDEMELADTAENGATEAFYAPWQGFSVSTKGGAKCRATVFADKDGSKVGMVPADGTSAFDGPGTFWVETAAAGCKLLISPGR